MKKFKVTVTRTIEYEVEVDENLWGVEQRKNFQNTFWNLDPTSYAGNNENEEAAAEFALALAQQSSRLGCNQFIEGFGMCAQDKKYADAWNKMEHAPGTSLCTNGLYIKEVDDDIDSEIEEIEE